MYKLICEEKDYDGDWGETFNHQYDTLEQLQEELNRELNDDLSIPSCTFRYRAYWQPPGEWKPLTIKIAATVE